MKRKMEKNIKTRYTLHATRYTSRGFTISEMLITVFLVSLIGIMISGFGSDIFKRNRVSQDRNVAIQDARLTLRRFLEESRSASQSSTGSYAISLASTTALTFYSDTDNDNLKERFRYYVQGGILKKGVTKPTGNPLVYVDANEKVFLMTKSLATTSVFTYYDTNGALLPGLATPSLVRSVDISLSISIKNESKASTTLTFKTRSTFRNLKDNY